jgi:glycosyltransferase involved in cell wall biosynthesis
VKVDVAIVGVHNHYGLSHDGQTVAQLLRCNGKSVTLVDYRKPPNYRARLNVFLELLIPELFPRAHGQIMIPNPEWWKPDWNRHLGDLIVLAKTRDCMRLFRQIGAHVTYTGFVPRSRFDPTVRRVYKFLHIAGQSKGRFTKRLIHLWMRHPEWPRLDVCATYLASKSLAPNVRVTGGYLQDSELRKKQNRSIFHICSSRYEGFGHTLWEALDCGAVVLATNAPPMSESISQNAGLPIQARLTGKKMGLAELADICSHSFSNAIRQALDLSESEILGFRKRARRRAALQRDIASQRILSAVDYALNL